MDAEMERKWALAKAELLKVQVAFLRIVLWRCKTFEELKTELQGNIDELEGIAQEYRDEAAKRDPDWNKFNNG